MTTAKRLLRDTVLGWAVGLAALLVLTRSVPPEIVVRPLPGEVPRIEARPGDRQNAPECERGAGSAGGVEAAKVARAGWIPLPDVQRAGLVRVVLGAASLDALCRPVGTEAFVFRGEAAIGAIAVRDPRAVPVVRFRDAETLVVEAEFHLPGDASCCPTGNAAATVALGVGGLAIR